MKYLNVLVSFISIMLLSCGINKEEHTDEVHNHDEQEKKVVLTEDQLKELYPEGNEFISFLANSETFDSTYSLKSERFLLYLSSINGRRHPIPPYEKQEIDEFIRLVGVEDQDYVQGQVESESDLKLDIQKSGKPIFITRDSMALAFDEKGSFRRGWIYYISTPIFSKNQKYVLVGHGFSCGTLCGGGYKEIYEKVSAKEWKRIKILSEWFS